ALEGLPPARRRGAGAVRRSTRPDPRRADHRARPGAGRRDPRPGPRPPRQPHRALLEPHPLRGGSALRARGRHRSWPHRRRGDAGGAGCSPRPQPPRGHLPRPGARRRARARAGVLTMLAIAGKELMLYFTSLLFYALASVFLVLSGWLFYTN